MFLNYRTLHNIKRFRYIAYPLSIVVAILIPTVSGLRIPLMMEMWICIELIAKLLKSFLVRCPKCNSRKITLSFPFHQLKPGTVIYCPECGQQIELLDPTDPRLKKKS